MEKNGKAGDESKRRDSGGDSARKQSPKKRRKVNHACVYCRRSHMTCDLERPCTRCIKRNIGHLCHDEPREAETKKPKNGSVSKDEQQQQDTTVEATQQSAQPQGEAITRTSISSNMGPPLPFDGTRQRSTSGSAGYASAPVMTQANPLPLVQQSALQSPALANSGNTNSNQFSGYSDAWMTAAQNFQDMNTFNPNYMITPEVTHEFNALGDFLQTSLLDDSGTMSVGDEQAQQQQRQAAFSRTGQLDASLPAFGGTQNNGTPAAGNATAASSGSMLPPPNLSAGRAISRPGSAVPGEKDKTSAYYLQAADPKGNEDPDARMAQVLQAKYDAGLLKPFNYVAGYGKLSRYLDGHIAASSKKKILSTIGSFRPKFREKAQALTDLQLVYVEMWFERQLMDYDRVFASMAVPACCWRRTGEIFRGNKEMAELIKVPVDQLRDGKIALHEILTEESMVRYWEEFGTIAFDPAHDTLLTACSLKNPSDTSEHPIVKCCFSFTIRRDDHKLPSLIVGNFLPHDPPRQ